MKHKLGIYIKGIDFVLNKDKISLKFYPLFFFFDGEKIKNFNGLYIPVSIWASVPDAAFHINYKMDYHKSFEDFIVYCHDSKRYDLNTFYATIYKMLVYKK